MESADELQLRHLIGPALQNRLRVVNGENDRAPTWHDFHQTGVLFSELAEAWYQVRRKRSAREQQILLRQALNWFAEAYQALDYDTALDTVELQANARAAINCDDVMAFARLARAINDPARMQSALDMFDGRPATAESEKIEGILAKCDTRAPIHPAFAHQAGIAYAFRGRLACGELFGFPAPTELLHAMHCNNKADAYLSVENSQDRHNAYRSFAMYVALSCFAIGSRKSARKMARAALALAKIERDKRHAVRALLIWLLGSTGNRAYYALGLLRDRPCT